MPSSNPKRRPIEADGTTTGLDGGQDAPSHEEPPAEDVPPALGPGQGARSFAQVLSDAVDKIPVVRDLCDLGRAAFTLPSWKRWAVWGVLALVALGGLAWFGIGAWIREGGIHDRWERLFPEKKPAMVAKEATVSETPDVNTAPLLDIIWRTTSEEGGLATVNPAKPLVGTVRGGDVVWSDPEVRIDDVPVPIDGQRIVLDDDTVSVLPRCGYWQPGPHRVYVATDVKRARPYSEVEFRSPWKIDFADEPQIPLVDIRDPKLVRGQVASDLEAGAISLDPERVDEDNPSYFKTAPVCDEVGDIRVGVRFRIDRYRSDCLQIVLPGSLTVQVADGYYGVVTIKCGDKYLARDGKSLVPQKHSGWRHGTRGNLADGKDHWVCVTFSKGVLSFATGAVGTELLFEQPIPREFVTGQNRDLAFRSYGSKILISQLRVTVPG